MTSHHAPVESGHLSEEEAPRPPITRDVMNGGEQDELFPVKLEERRTQERTAFEIERQRRLRLHQAAHLDLANLRRQVREIHPRQVPASCGMDALHRAITDELEAGPQAPVATHHLLECARQ